MAFRALCLVASHISALFFPSFVRAVGPSFLPSFRASASPFLTMPLLLAVVFISLALCDVGCVRPSVSLSLCLYLCPSVMALLILQASAVMLQEQMTACNVAMSLKADRAQLSAIEATCSKLRAFEDHVEKSKAQIAALEAAAAARGGLTNP